MEAPKIWNVYTFAARGSSMARIGPTGVVGFQRGLEASDDRNCLIRDRLDGRVKTYGSPR